MSIGPRSNVYDQISTCTVCTVGTTCKRFGGPTPPVGTGELKVMFVGRNPGREEAFQGKPFVGRSRQSFNAMLSILGLSREQVWVTYLMKCYTTVPKLDRAPTKEEIDTCVMVHLDKEIDFVKPRVIVTLGKDAFFKLTDGEHGSTCSGKTGSLYPYKKVDWDCSVYVLHHPAYVARRSHALGMTNNTEIENLSNILMEKGVTSRVSTEVFPDFEVELF